MARSRAMRLVLVSIILLLSVEGYMPRTGPDPGVVYVSGTETSVWCLNASTGQVIWHFQNQCMQSVSTSPGISRDGATLLVGCRSREKGGEVMALHAANGTMRWAYSNRSMLPSEAPASDATGRVFQNNFDRDLYALDTAQGNLLWLQSIPSGSGEGLSPTVSADGNSLFFTNGGLKNVYAVRTSDGKLLWSQNVTSYVISLEPSHHSPARLFVGDFKNLTALDATTGRIAWSRRLDNGPTSYNHSGAPTVGVSADDSTLYAAGYGALHAVSTKDGSIKWSKIFGGDLGTFPYGATPSLDNRMVFTSLTKPMSVLALSAEDGSFVWQANFTSAYVPHPPQLSVDGNTLFVGDDAGPMHAVAVKDGTIKWTFGSEGIRSGSTPHV